MAIPTSRTKSKAEITIHTAICTGCGLCVSVCKDFSLEVENAKARISDHSLFGCVGCGHCMAICPANAIEISGRTMTPDDLFDLAGMTETASYEQLLSLLQQRRSIREFTETPIENTLITNILDGAQTSPMGLPPSDVHVLVYDSKEKGRAFAEDFCAYLEGMKWLVSNWCLAIMRPFWGKANEEMFRGFIKPLFQIYTENMQNGVDLVTYGAPLTMYFYGSPYSDPADPIIAATYAMITAEALGLGSCMLGGIHPLIQYGKHAKEFRKKQEIKCRSREGLFVIFGYPSVKYKKGLRRTFASIDYKCPDKQDG